MKKNVMIMVAVSGLTITAAGNEKNEIIVNQAIKNGGITINSTENVIITPDVMEIINQISKSKELYTQPVLILKKDEIQINDRKKLEDILAKPDQTMTSL